MLPPPSSEPSGDAAPADPALFGAAHARRGRALYRTGLALLGGALVYLTATANVTDLVHLYQGLAIFALAFVPGLLWARDGGSRFPVFEPIMLLCANSYALPLLNGHRQLALYPADIITTGGWAVLLYQGAAIAAYLAVRGRPGRGAFWTEPMLTPRLSRNVIYGVGLSTLYLLVATFTEWIPWEINSILRAIFFGIGILSTFVTTQRWGAGELTPHEKALFLGMLLPQLVIQIVGLLLIAAVALLGISLLGYLSGGKRVPWVPIVVAFATLAILHNGKSDMRKKYWEGGLPSPTVSELPAFFTEWVELGLTPPRAGAEEESSAGTKLLERSSLMHILCLVIDYTPARQPFLNGETYGYILPQLIPRFFWPNKPRSHIATYRLSIYYGLQDEEATAATTIAFGMLAEAYANFGLFGGALLGALTGLVLKKLQHLSRHSPIFSLAGLLMILLTAWSFNSEMTMAVWISSLYQALIVVLGVPFALRQLSGS